MTRLGQALEAITASRATHCQHRRQVSANVLKDCRGKVAFTVTVAPYGTARREREQWGLCKRHYEALADRLGWEIINTLLRVDFDD